MSKKKATSSEQETPWYMIRVPIPSGMNTKCSPARVSVMKRVFGSPKGTLTDKCAGKEAAPPKIKLVTREVGKMKLTGHEPFLGILSEVFAEYARRYPDAYNDLTTAGCYCARLVRGSATQPSNHSWGTAIDLGFRGVIDERGDGMIYAGLLKFYSIAKEHGLFCGATFATEDSMHFEASNELVLCWEAGTKWGK